MDPEPVTVLLQLAVRMLQRGDHRKRAEAGAADAEDDEVRETAAQAAGELLHLFELHRLFRQSDPAEHPVLIGRLAVQFTDGATELLFPGGEFGAQDRKSTRPNPSP